MLACAGHVNIITGHVNVCVGVCPTKGVFFKCFKTRFCRWSIFSWACFQLQPSRRVSFNFIQSWWYWLINSNKAIVARIHYSDVIMTEMTSKITSLTVVYWSVYSGAGQRKHQSSASLVFVRGIHRWPVNSPHKGPVTRKMSPFDDVIMSFFPHTVNGSLKAFNLMS